MTALGSLWNGTLRYEEVVLPVALAAARGGSDVALRTLHRPCSSPLVQFRECPIHGDVPLDEVVSGWQVSPGEYVLIEPDEIKALAPAADRTIEVLQSFATAELDLTLVEGNYWLMPTASVYARDTYATIAAGLGSRNSLLVRFTYLSEKVAAVRSLDGVLLLQVLGAVADRHPSSPIADALAEAKVSRSQRRLARLLVEGTKAPLDESLIVNRRRSGLRTLIEQKLAAGATTVIAPPAPDVPLRGASADPVDLEAALRASLDRRGVAAA